MALEVHIGLDLRIASSVLSSITACTLEQVDDRPGYDRLVKWLCGDFDERIESRRFNTPSNQQTDMG
jgi:hypothetical protein